MPIHDWTRVPAGLFHDFHRCWTVHISSALNAGLLPPGLSALFSEPTHRDTTSLSDEEAYAHKANRIFVQRNLRRTVAVIEVVSPGDKCGERHLKNFVDRAADLIRGGVHVLIVDLFPPTRRDPVGIHQLIWNHFQEGCFEFPAGKDRVLASYEAGDTGVAYVEPVTVGDLLPIMPLFVKTGGYVSVPLESAYQAAWAACSEGFREVVETGVLPEDDDEGEQ